MRLSPRDTAALRGGLVVCGATSDAGKSFVTTGLCRLLARRGVRVAPFKAQNMSLNSAVTADGGEISHAQWVQAIAAGVEPEVAMNPVLLKPTANGASQVIVMGQAVAVRSTAEHHASVGELRTVVHDALTDLRCRFGVVVCEGAGGAAEINLLDRDLANLPLAHVAGLPAIVVGDIDRGGVFAALYGTVALLPHELRRCVRGFVINRLRGDPGLLAPGLDELQRRTGIPVLGVVPWVPGADLDAEDSLALDAWGTATRADGPALDVAVVRFPHVANFGDVDPLRIEPHVRVRWVRSAAELGQPHLVVLPGSKSTCADLGWFRSSGLDRAVERSGAAVLAICGGLQMVGEHVDDPIGVEGDAGTVRGLAWLPVRTRFEAAKVLDRPSATAVDGPASGCTTSGYRIHNGRVEATSRAATWLVDAHDDAIGWWSDRVAGTTLHGLLEDDDFRAAVLRWAAAVSGVPAPPLPGAGFAATRQARLDAIADALDAHLDLDQLAAIMADAAPIAPAT